MKRLQLHLARSLFLLALSTSCAMAGEPDLACLARDASGEDAVLRARAVTALREAGLAGLEALRSENAELLERGPSVPKSTHWTTQTDCPWERFSRSMDEVAGARDAYSSGLYWYTDLDQAKAAAKAVGKPILSLRLLGGLDEEDSCANSRYFRTALYANKNLSGYLRENYILHWKSVRNVPRVTIDFGDGRRIERTLTGNSIHYVLDAEGNVIDALPGLYGPATFMRELRAAGAIAKAPSTPSARAEFAAAKAGEIANAWRDDLKKLGMELPVEKLPGLVAASGPVPAAPDVDMRTVTKSLAERPILKEIFPAAAMKPAPDTAGWDRIARLHRQTPELDSGSIRLMRDKSSILRASPTPSAAPMVAAFENAIALDTVRNEYLMHRKLCEWLAQSRGTVDLEGFNDRVFNELFLTPASDPWLGLLPQDVYTALDGDGAHDGTTEAVSNAR